MKSNIYIIVLIISLLSGCRTGNRESAREMTFKRESVGNVKLDGIFENDSLSEIRLRAFEDRAIQKLHDVLDLIEILSEPQNENTFRLQAKTMLLENFENPDENQIALILPDIKPFHYSLEQFSDSLMNNRFMPLKLKILESSIKRPLALVGKNKFQGIIYFQMEPTANFKTLYPKDVMVNIVLKKATKDFGGSSRDVWEVFLGDIGE